MGKVYSVPRLQTRKPRDVEAAIPVENEKPLQEKATAVITSSHCPECQLEAATANGPARGHSRATESSSVCSRVSHASHTSSGESQADTVLLAQASPSISPPQSLLTSGRDHTSLVEEIATHVYRNPLPKYPAATNNPADRARYIRPETRPSRLKHLWAVTRLNQWLCFGLFVALTVLIPLAVEAIMWKITGVIPGNSWLTWAYPNPLQSSVVVIQGSSATFTVGLVSKPPKPTLTLVTSLTSTARELGSMSTEISSIGAAQSPIPSEPRPSQAPSVVEISTPLAVTAPPLPPLTTALGPSQITPDLKTTQILPTQLHDLQVRAIAGTIRSPVFVADARIESFTFPIPSLQTSHWATLKVTPTSYRAILNPDEQENTIHLLEERISTTRIKPEGGSAATFLEQIFSSAEARLRLKGLTIATCPITTTPSQLKGVHERDRSSTIYVPVFFVGFRTTYAFSAPLMPSSYWTTLKCPFSRQVSLTLDEEAAMSSVRILASAAKIDPHSQEYYIPSDSTSTCTAWVVYPCTLEPASTTTRTIFWGVDS
ncbi:hypothetical protein BGZ60DRAFT_527231 [Tricladium varicosporioides]|nr:hypothetical protein BGZ60DRAFT_527231 [Hymenoscyphus varicosporioides]